MRKLKLHDLYDLFLRLDNGNSNFALDALPLLRTDAAVAFMVETVQAGKISKERQIQWFSTFASYKNPTKPMLEAVVVSPD